MTIIWTVSGFTYYLLEFYVKYFPGNVFFNKALFGVADSCSIWAIKYLQLKFDTVKSVLRIVLAIVAIISLIFLFSKEINPVLTVPILVGLIRMSANCVQSYGYHVNQHLFGPLVRGATYSFTNGISRPISGLAPIVAELSNEPIKIVFFINLLCIPVTLMLSEVHEETLKEWTA